MRRLALAFMLLLPGFAAQAHPHVLISASTVVVVDETGVIVALRHAWTFDEAFSTFSTQGLDKNGDGKLSREELADLAKINVESLHEYGFFTRLGAGRDKAVFDAPRDYYLEHDGKALTLNFTLPLKGTRPPIKDVRLSVDDPSYFVAFSFAPKDPVRVEGSGCNAKVKGPRPEAVERLSRLSEADFASGNFANAEGATQISFECP